MRATRYWPSTGKPVYVRPNAVNVPPVIVVSAPLKARHVGSPSVAGSVYVTQSTILRSPVLVTLVTGLSRSTPVSRMPIVVPRPSHVGCALTNCAAPCPSWACTG
jgi:hypothetical protein